MTRTIAYLRVSTDKQADQGLSLEMQRTKINHYAELYDLHLIRTETDAGLSAKTTDRPGLQRALAALRKKQADALLVIKLDRLTRSVKDLGLLVEHYFAEGKYSLLSVGEQIDTRTAAGRLVLNVLASVAQWEREIIGERTSDAMRCKAQKGEYTGGKIPYGYTLTQDRIRLAPIPTEQHACSLVSTLRQQGHTLHAIAQKLREHGHTPRASKTWHPMQIKRILDKQASV